MSYLETRAESEIKAVTVLKKLLKGAGKLAGVFYVAAGSRTGPVGVVFELASRDTSGVKTLNRGKSMAKSLSEGSTLAPFLARGTVRIEGKTLVLEVKKKKGNLDVLHKAIWKNLYAQSSAQSKLLGKLLKRSRFESEIEEDAQTPEDQTFLDAEDDSGVPDLTEEELETLLGSVGSVHKLIREQKLTSGRLSALAATLAKETDEEALASAVKALIATDPLTESVLVGLDDEIAALVSTGPDPFAGETLSPDAGILQFVVGQRRKALTGVRSRGYEVEFLGVKMHTRVPMPDHTKVFRTPHFVYQFETQGSEDDETEGTLEAISLRPFDPNDPANADLVQTQNDEINTVLAALKTVEEFEEVALSALLTKIRTNGVELTVLFDPKRFGAAHFEEVGSKGVRRAAQITQTESLETLYHRFKAGDFPTSQSGKADTERRQAMMKDCAADADKLFAELGVGSLSPPLSKGEAEATKSLLALLSQNIRALCTDLDHRKNKKTRYRSAAAGSQDARGKERARSFEKKIYWAKDYFALLPKTPLAFLLHGVKTDSVDASASVPPAVQALFKQKKSAIKASCDAIMKAQNPRFSTEDKIEKLDRDDPSLKIATYIGGLLNPPPARDAAEYENWVEKHTDRWHRLIGDTGSACILQADVDGSLRSAHEIRQTSATEDLASHTATLDQADERAERGSGVFDGLEHLVDSS